MTDCRDLCRLIYVSNKDRYIDTKCLKDILNKAKKYNHSLEISGILVFNSRFFLQALEGPRKNVNMLFRKIAKDSRHSDIELLKMDMITDRQWGNWSMEFISITDIEQNLYQKYINQDKFNPYLLNSKTVNDFLSDLNIIMKDF